MEILVGVALVVGVAVAVAIVFRTGLWLLFAVALPIAWLWMLVDSILRTDAEYPSRDSVEKIVWIVLILLVHPAAIAYYVLVYRKQKRGQVPISPVPVAPPAPLAPPMGATTQQG